MNRTSVVLMLVVLLATVAGATELCGVFSLYEEELPEPFTPLWVGPADTLYAYHGFDGTVRKSTDHGGTWDIIQEFPGTAGCKGLFVDSRGTIFACFPSPADNAFYGKLQMGRFEGRGERVWSEPLEFQCSKSFWKMCEDLQGNLFAGEYTNGAYEDTCAVIWRSVDEGTNWEKVYEGTGRHVHFVACDPNTGSIYAAIGDGFARAKLMRSNNHGNTWVEILTQTGLYQQPISIVCTPTHRVFGSDWGDFLWPWNSVYRTDDDTYSDQLILMGDENTYVWMMTRNPDGIIFAGTVTREYGEGRPAIYMSLDDGATWCKAKSLGGDLEPWWGVTWMSNFDSDGWAYYHDRMAYKTYRFRAGDPSGVPEPVVASASLSAPTPNPSAGRTSIEFSLPSAGRARLAVYDISGRLVRTIADGTFAPGSHPAAWDGMDARGRPVASGVYFVRLEIAGESSGQKLLLVK